MPDPAQLAALRQQLAQAQAEANRAYSAGGVGGAWSNGAVSQAQHNTAAQRAAMLQSQLRQMTPAAPSEYDQMTAQRDANRNQILANTEGRANELRSDPRAGAALDFLQGVVGGQNLPFGQQMQANYLTNAANTAGAQEAAQTQALREQMANNGGSMTDPSAMAALRELQSRRGGQIAQAQNQIGMQAGQANFGAQMQGANSLAAVNNSQNAQINQMLGGANAARLGSTFNFGGQPQIGGQQLGGGSMVNLGTVGGQGHTNNGIGNGTIVNDQGQFGGGQRYQGGGNGDKAPVNPAWAPPSPWQGGQTMPVNGGGRTVGTPGPMAGSGQGWQVGNGDPIQPGYGVVQLAGRPDTAQYYNGMGTGNGDTYESMDRARARLEKPVDQFGQSFGPILGR